MLTNWMATPVARAASSQCWRRLAGAMDEWCGVATRGDGEGGEGLAQSRGIGEEGPAECVEAREEPACGGVLVGEEGDVAELGWWRVEEQGALAKCGAGEALHDEARLVRRRSCVRVRGHDARERLVVSFVCVTGASGVAAAVSRDWRSARSASLVHSMSGAMSSWRRP